MRGNRMRESRGKEKAITKVEGCSKHSCSCTPAGQPAATEMSHSCLFSVRTCTIERGKTSEQGEQLTMSSSSTPNSKQRFLNSSSAAFQCNLQFRSRSSSRKEALTELLPDELKEAIPLSVDRRHPSELHYTQGRGVEAVSQILCQISPGTIFS